MIYTAVRKDGISFRKDWLFTIYSYTASYNRIKESLGWRRLNSIDLILMQQAFNELETDASRRDTKKVLADMYNKAVNSELVLKNIAKQINPIVTGDGKSKEPRVLTIEETEWFLDEAQRCQYYNLFYLGLETGMRIGEILGLKWSDVDFKNRIIHVNRTLVYVQYRNEDSLVGDKKYVYEFHPPKTEKGKRCLPMTSKVCEVLENQRLLKAQFVANCGVAEKKFEDLVFVTRMNAPVSAEYLSVAMKRISNRIGQKHESFKPLTPHTLRHTFATRCIERGMNPKTLQIILGHSNINVTMNLYCHVTEDTLFSEMEKFETGGNQMV